MHSIRLGLAAFVGEEGQQLDGEHTGRQEEYENGKKHGKKGISSDGQTNQVEAEARV